MSNNLNLQLISGTVSELETEEGQMHVLMSSMGQTGAGAASVAAAAMGAFASSAIIMNAATSREPAKFFTFMLGELRVSGCFNNITINNGDKVEVVVQINEQDPTQANAYAVRVPERKHLWIAPLMNIGHAASIRNAIHLPWIILMFIVPPIMLLMLFGFYFLEGSFSFLKEIWWFFPAVGIGGGHSSIL